MILFQKFGNPPRDTVCNLKPCHNIYMVRCPCAPTPPARMCRASIAVPSGLSAREASQARVSAMRYGPHRRDSGGGRAQRNRVLAPADTCPRDIGGREQRQMPESRSTDLPGAAKVGSGAFRMVCDDSRAAARRGALARPWNPHSARFRAG